SRRRHTRSDRDWSSDVCSSDLGGPIFITKKLVDMAADDAELAYVLGHETGHIDHKHIVKAAEKQQPVALGVNILGALIGRGKNRSEERRVGKGCRARRALGS